MAEPLTIAGTLALIKKCLDIMKQAKDLMPEKAQSELSAKIQEAEKEFDEAKMKLAKELGYPLCRCDFPPTIMLYNKDEESYTCSKCGNEHGVGPILPPSSPYVF